MNTQERLLKPNEIDAIIFDLDGVITRTRNTHMKAWKYLFDDFLRSQGNDDEMDELDYLDYIDGKPRYEGVRSFLESRDIELPFGNEDDEPGHDTVCALGNLKNQKFQKLVRTEGVEVYEAAVDRLKEYRSKGIKMAVVSSSKNCKTIVEQGGLANFFDTRVDGIVSAERGLEGKPNPDIFLEAARELNARPEKSIVFEDANAGVQAGQHGFFALVVGVAHHNNEKALLENGADIVIKDFDDFELFEDEELAGYFRPSKPMVFSENSKVFDLLKKKKPAFFLDYDGTLTPIVNRPEDAVITGEMRQTLKKLAQHFTVAVVTGRDKEDVQEFIKLDNIIYSGSHGYVTEGPNGLYMEHEKSEEIIRRLDAVEKDLHDLLDGQTEGFQVERKRYAIAVHYRNASEKDVPYVFKVVDKMLEKHEEIKKGEGKMVVEIKPDIDWHKGKAVTWIYEKLGFNKQDDTIPVFIGDDVTDEDAFHAIKDFGIGILVENKGQDTEASFTLKNVFQVRAFFNEIIRMYQDKQ